MNDLNPPQSLHTSSSTLMPSLDVQHAWFELQAKKTWRTLGFLSIEPDQGCYYVAEQFAWLAALQPQTNLVLMKGHTGIVNLSRVAQQKHGYDIYEAQEDMSQYTQVAMISLPNFIEQVHQGVSRYNQMMIALPSVLEQPLLVSVARMLDAVILCPRLEQTPLSKIKRVIEMIGHERIVGSVVLK